VRAAQEQTFVGRALERQRLEDPLTRAVAGRAGVVLVLGELGSGKTALLEVFLSATARSGVLSAAADEAQTALPFGVLDQVWHDLDALGSLSGGGPEPPVAGPPVVHGTHRCGARPHRGGRPAPPACWDAGPRCGTWPAWRRSWTPGREPGPRAVRALPPRRRAGRPGAGLRPRPDPSRRARVARCVGPGRAAPVRGAADHGSYPAAPPGRGERRNGRCPARGAARRAAPREHPGQPAITVRTV